MNTKSILASKTFWVQVLAILIALAPAVQLWLAANPVEFVAVLAAVNVIVRFVTSGKISIFAEGNNGDETGGKTLLGVLFVVVMGLGTAAVGFLSSCSTPGGFPISGSISYRDPASGAKAGLVFSPDHSPQASLKVPIYDAETGELIGMADLSAPIPTRQPAVDAASGK